MKIRKAVIPAAGLGTRMLPATKTVPKELLTLVDRPVLQYIVQEAVSSGIEEVIIITSPGKEALHRYFQPAPELEERLHRLGKREEARAVRRPAKMAKFSFVMQEQQRGLGHAIWCARELVGNEPFAILLGDDIMYNREKPVLKQLIEAAERHDCSAIACREVDDEHVVKYSSLKLEPLEERVYRIQDMNEKPTLEEKFSNFSIMGRYVLTPEIFEILENVEPGRNNEIQLTDGMRVLMDRAPMVAVDFEGERYDTGNPRDYVRTFVEFALEDPEVGPWVREYLKERVKDL